ncbi:MAG: hypothetical protein IPL84_13190 [Chitinophagaceae bacterium]|nr:hypothetical protein [Chitinophagaceae bacterium]
MTSTLDATDPTMTSRIFRDGVPSTCPVPKACPGPFGSGTHVIMKVFNYVNPSLTPVCVTASPYINHNNTGSCISL